MIEPYPLLKYTVDNSKSMQKKLQLCHGIGFIDMITNSKLTHLYASGTNKVIYCFSLDSNSRSKWIFVLFNKIILWTNI